MPDATRSQYSLSVRLCTESFANSSTHFLSIFRSLKYQGLMGPYFRAKWNSRKKSYTTSRRTGYCTCRSLGIIRKKQEASGAETYAHTIVAEEIGGIHMKR